MPITTYFIGGIATDAQLYAHQLAQIPNSVYLRFPKQAPADTMATYVLKFLPSIDLTKPFNLVGCSMGGIMVMELLNHLQPEKVILISSVKCRKEMPWRLRQLKYTKLHRLFSGRSFIKSVTLGSRFISELKTVSGLREQVISMAKNNTPDFLYWCVNAIVNWSGSYKSAENIIHIHGDKDGMFPIKNIENPMVVAAGTHKMLLSRKEEMTSLLISYLS